MGRNRVYWYTVDDSSGTMRMTLLEEEVVKMEEGRSYRLMVVREFRERNFLSTLKQKSTVEKVDDIGNIEDEEGSTVQYHYDVWFKGKEGWFGSAETKVNLSFKQQLTSSWAYGQHF